MSQKGFDGGDADLVGGSSLLVRLTLCGSLFHRTVDTD